MLFNLIITIDFHQKAKTGNMTTVNNIIRRLKDMGLQWSGNGPSDDSDDYEICFTEGNPTEEIEEAINSLLFSHSHKKGPLKSYICNWSRTF